ncbi:hypothetical protein V8C86DRAFT_1001527 [Haematococcus lacustris]
MATAHPYNETQAIMSWSSTWQVPPAPWVGWGWVGPVQQVVGPRVGEVGAGELEDVAPWQGEVAPGQEGSKRSYHALLTHPASQRAAVCVAVMGWVRVDYWGLHQGQALHQGGYGDSSASRNNLTSPVLSSCLPLHSSHPATSSTQTSRWLGATDGTPNSALFRFITAHKVSVVVAHVAKRDQNMSLLLLIAKETVMSWGM